MGRINDRLRKFYNNRLRKKLTNRTFSLISSNCNGGCILHDLGLEFNTPFINLWIEPNDFIRLCANLKHYLSYELKFLKNGGGLTYPVGLLDDIKIYFQHYSSEQEAKEKWDKRKQRINYNNIFILFTDRDGCDNKTLKAFDKLDFKNKVVFCNKEYPEIQSAVYIHGFEHEKSVGQCMEFRNRFTYKKYYDDFNYVSWFNGNNKD